MSAEGSDNSRTRQFSWYRSIDARTDEFLKLSKKRQLKQGCACAAISMIITITVVIIVILVYEYTVISDSNTKSTLNPSWLKFMNSSGKDLPFEVKLDNAKIGLDAATIKFLPLILKTLKKNKYFDRIDDTLNPSPNKLETRDDVYKNNIFSDTRNWMKMPTSRFYTIEYKTSPIVYFKNPTRNIDKYKKARKVRDYQRIMNYVDKMINERVTFGSTVSLTKKYNRIHKNAAIYEYTTPMPKIKDLERKTQKVASEKVKTVSPVKKSDCNCPKRMGDLLKKLISNLQSLVPNFNEDLSKNSKQGLCNYTQTTQPNKIKKVTNSYDSSTKFPIRKTQSIKPSKTTVAQNNVDYTLNNIIELLKPGLLSRRNLNLHLKTATENHLKSNNAYYSYIKNLTESAKSSLYTLPATATTISDYVLKRDSSKTKTTSTNTVLTEKDYDDYIDATTKVIYSKKHDTPNSKLVKSDNIKNGNYENIHNKYTKESTNTYKQLSSDSTTDMTELSSSSTFQTIDFDTSMDFNNVNLSLSAELSTKGVLDFEVSTNLPKADKKLGQPLKSEDITLEEELIKTNIDDITPEESIKHLEDIIKTLNSTATYTTSNAPELFEWELVNIEDYTNNILNSMIPQNKASYLEIERTDWKPDEHQDYDNNVNTYFFE